MPFFRKKPVMIEARQFTAETWEDIEKWSEGNAIAHGNWKHKNDVLWMIIKTLEGNHTANINDWIIKGVKGEFYPCKPDIFTATYDLVEE